MHCRWLDSCTDPECMQAQDWLGARETLKWCDVEMNGRKYQTKPKQPLNEGPHIQDLSGPRSRQDLGLEAELGVQQHHLCLSGPHEIKGTLAPYSTPDLTNSLSGMWWLFLCTFLHLHSSASHAPQHHPAFWLHHTFSHVVEKVWWLILIVTLTYIWDQLKLQRLGTPVRDFLDWIA